MLGYSSHSHHFISVTDQRYINWTLRVASVHGLTSQLPFIKSIEVISRKYYTNAKIVKLLSDRFHLKAIQVSFSDNHNYKDAVLDKQPFLMKR